MDEVWVVWGTDAVGRPSGGIEVWDSEGGARASVEARGCEFRETVGDWRSVWDERACGVRVGKVHVDRLPVRRSGR